jgi:hypothetical protein
VLHEKPLIALSPLVHFTRFVFEGEKPRKKWEDIAFQILRSPLHQRRVILNNKELPFRLPAKAEKVYTALHEGTPDHYHTRYSKQWRAEAERIAWRICKTWLEAQITLINLEQAKFEEVFLPYLIMPNDKTLFETMEHNQFLLPNGS